MKAAVFRAKKGDLCVEQRENPQAGQGEVVIRVHACGVCHGDLMVQNGDFPFVRYPIVPGHEVAGVIESVGPGVEHVRSGMRVGVPWLSSACGHCRQCIHGDEVLCAEGQYVGMTRDGGFQELMVAQADYVVPLPDALGFSEAAPIMCAGLTMYSGLVHAGFEPGDKVAVVGLGGLGSMGVLFARAMGGRVAVVSTTSGKADEARLLGAEKFIHAGAVSAGDALKAWDGGADIILQVAPSPELASSALQGLAADGVFALLTPVPVAIDPNALIMGRQRVMGSPSGSRKELRAALELAATHKLHPPIKCYSLGKAGNALADLQTSHPAGRGVIVMN
jgi:D-arabinose 1-dehydrogenase-like Zn-dependent alcohol dehydrogenase